MATQHAAAEIIKRAATASGRSTVRALNTLGKIKVRISRERKKAVAVRLRKVPPVKRGE